MRETLKLKLPSHIKVIPQARAQYWFHKDRFYGLPMKEKRIVVKSLCFWDIGWFAQKVTQRWTRGKKTKQRFHTPEFHRELWEVSLDGEDVVVICPRGFAKTTAVSKIFVLWLLLFGLEPSILLVSSKGLGEEIIGDIKRELEENTVIAALWGVLIPIDATKDSKSAKWRQNELQLLNGMEIKTVTKGQAVRGRRPTLILVDDPEENKDVRNPAISEQFFQWFFTALYNALDDGGHVIVLGTVISANCFVNRLSQEAKERNFRVLNYPAVLGFDFEIWKNTKDWGKSIVGGKSLWPEKWSLEKLEKKLKKIGELPFMQEFMNVPFTINATPVFTGAKTLIVSPMKVEGNWTFYQDLDSEGGLVGFAGIDVANGSQAGDYSVCVIRDAQMKLVAVYRGKVPQDVFARECDTVFSRLVDCFIVPENNIALAFINASRDYVWYEKMYRRKSMDKVTMKESEEVGWNTNAKTKILLITEYHSTLRAEIEVSDVMQEEIDHYYYDEKGGMNGLAPYHDDLVIGDALSIQAVKHGLLAPLFQVF